MLLLEAESLNFWEDLGAFPKPQYQCLCTSSDIPTPTLQLEAGSPSRSHRRLRRRLEGAEGIEQPSSEPYRMVPEKSGGVSGRSGVSGTSVALSTLVYPKLLTSWCLCH